eukprot:TRINITY_DN100711_c0_g1_i1.p1 TRINITY_DN100711_c0_g1~~TRINITY_DN100711_c0_g1_i1.p1  ORF type:complete len:276 (+),score=39.69 TRINITY_DN100711_c0_g1_i1:74-901(+)
MGCNRDIRWRGRRRQGLCVAILLHLQLPDAVAFRMAAMDPGQIPARDHSRTPPNSTQATTQKDSSDAEPRHAEQLVEPPIPTNSTSSTSKVKSDGKHSRRPSEKLAILHDSSRKAQEGGHEDSRPIEKDHKGSQQHGRHAASGAAPLCAFEDTKGSRRVGCATKCTCPWMQRCHPKYVVSNLASSSNSRPHHNALLDSNGKPQTDLVDVGVCVSDVRSPIALMLLLPVILLGSLLAARSYQKRELEEAKAESIQPKLLADALCDPASIHLPRPNS